MQILQALPRRLNRHRRRNASGEGLLPGCAGRLLFFIPVLALVFLPAAARAQVFAPPVRIGVVTGAWGPPAGLQALIGGLEDLGYEEKFDFVVAVRFTQGDPTALPAAARAIVEGGVDVLIPVGTLAVEAALGATSDQPIVFIGADDPVGRNLVASFSRPGGNVTGVTGFDLDGSGKRLQLFRELVPDLTTVLFAYNESNLYDSLQAEEYRRAAELLNLALVERSVRTLEEARLVLSQVEELDIDGILSPTDVDLNIPGLILEVSELKDVPAMFGVSDYVDLGGFASYGGSMDAAGRQAARMIHMIINGADPADIPVETGDQLEFVINLRVAAELAIEVPPEALLQADRIVQ